MKQVVLTLLFVSLAARASSVKVVSEITSEIEFSNYKALNCLDPDPAPLMGERGQGWVKLNLQGASGEGVALLTTDDVRAVLDQGERCHELRRVKEALAKSQAKAQLKRVVTERIQVYGAAECVRLMQENVEVSFPNFTRTNGRSFPVLRAQNVFILEPLPAEQCESHCDLN